MADFYIGQIIQGGWNFAPNGTNVCDGSLLSIAQNAALFSLLGTTYGGDGQSTFGLPDLRGRSMLGQGQSPGLSTYVLGQMSGSENANVLIANLPSHTHTATFNSSSTMSAASTRASTALAAPGSVLGRAADGAPTPTSQPEIYCPAGTATPDVLGGLNVAGTVSISPTGGGQSFSIQNPYLVINQVIVLYGIFPSRP